MQFETLVGSRASNPGPKWQSQKSGIFFEIYRDPGNSRDLLKIIFIIDLARDTRCPNPYTSKAHNSKQIKSYISVYMYKPVKSTQKNDWAYSLTGEKLPDKSPSVKS